MEYIHVTPENLEQEHICCAISNNKDIQVSAKKKWMKEQFDDGLIFLKSKERGKCFIEYMPAENAWVPIVAKDFMYIDCLWVSGAMKGHGYSNELLQKCIEDSKAKGKKGLCILSSAKKRAFLADPKYLAYKGFAVADESDIGITLMYLAFSKTDCLPHFTEKAKHPTIEQSGFVVYYTGQCPFTAKYVPLIEKIAKEHKVTFQSIFIASKEEAQAMPSPCTSYAMFYNGKFLTNEIASEKKFLKMIEKLQE